MPRYPSPSLSVPLPVMLFVGHLHTSPHLRSDSYTADYEMRLRAAFSFHVVCNPTLLSLFVQRKFQPYHTHRYIVRNPPSICSSYLILPLRTGALTVVIETSGSVFHPTLHLVRHGHIISPYAMPSTCGVCFIRESDAGPRPGRTRASASTSALPQPPDSR